MSFREELNKYRKSYGLVRDNIKQKEEAAAANADSAWAPQTNIPDGEIAPAWGARVDLPEELPNYMDDRVSGNQEIDTESFKAYMSEHPFAQQQGDKVADLVEELSKMVQDPENPMSFEEAQSIYAQEFDKLYSGWEQGGSDVQ